MDTGYPGFQVVKNSRVGLRSQPRLLHRMLHATWFFHRLSRDGKRRERNGGLGCPVGRWFATVGFAEVKLYSHVPTIFGEPLDHLTVMESKNSVLGLPFWGETPDFFGDNSFAKISITTYFGLRVWLHNSRLLLAAVKRQKRPWKWEVVDSWSASKGGFPGG